MKTYGLTILYILFSLSAFTQVRQDKPKVYVVSNAHFDTQWNWDVQTSINEYVLNTLNQNLFLLKKYPDYIFNFEGGIKYFWMKEYYPDQYEQVRNYVRLGRWHVAGSSWDATDTNIPSPESFTRNILYGQSFYQDEFGVKGTDIFLPDCFGFSYTLPTIASHCGLIGFSTQKLQWRINPFYGTSKVPFDLGLWEGIDGARIMLAANGHDYTTKWKDEDISNNKSLIEIAQSSPLNCAYHYYGTGDIGGSPTIESVLSVEKGLKGNGPLQIISATSDRMYKDYIPFDKHSELPVYKGELLMDIHGTGCYTSQAAMKFYNRKNELLGDAAERAAVMADWFGGLPYPKQILTEAWRRFIWHQFHDDLTGTSIPRAYEFSWNDELLSQKQFAQVLTSSSGSVAGALDTDVKGIPLIVYNPISQPVKEVIEVTIDLPKPVQYISIYDKDGKEIPSQFLSYKDGKASFLLAPEVSPLSYTVYDVRMNKSGRQSSLKANEHSTENSIYKVTLNQYGDISSILDKRSNKELVKSGKSIRLALFPENESYSWPAWEILKKEIDKDPVSIVDDVKISIAEQGPVRSAICVERKYKDSVFKQYIRLTEGGQDDRIDIVSEIDWQSSNALLKAEFPLNVNNEKAVYDLGIGNIERGNNSTIAYEVCGQYWADLTVQDNSYGVSIMNNCKYGWDKPDDHTLRLTLLHTPKTQGRYTYQDKQDLGYHTFTYSILGHTGGYNDAKTVLKAEILNQPPKAFIAEKHQGELGRSFSFIHLNNDQVIVKALKKGEKSDDYIIRLYETAGKEANNVEVSFAGDLQEARELNGVEEVIAKASANGNKLTFSMAPFSIKTFSVKIKPNRVGVTPPVSVSLPLNYNVKTSTYNAFCREANFDGKGNSFAAELLPETIDVDGISFNLGDPAVKNGFKCAGDTIVLPQNGQYNKLYFLASSTSGDNKVVFYIDNTPYEFIVPYYSGFVGQWEHTGHTQGFFKPAEVAYIGTHKHSMIGNKDVPYEFTYMFKFGMDIPKNAKKLILPNNTRIVLFSASLAQTKNERVSAATQLINTSLKNNNLNPEVFVRINLLKGKPVIKRSGEVNEREKSEFAFDDNSETKWCDVSNNTTKFIEIDLGREEPVKGWFVSHAGMETPEFITREYNLEVKKDLTDSWTKVDAVTNNSENETDRLLSKPVTGRYIRLSVNKPEQHDGNTARIYEFQVY